MSSSKRRVAERLGNRFKFYDKITPEMDEWEIVEELQQKGFFPHGLREVFVYGIARQYERNVLEMEGVRVVSVEPVKPFFPFMLGIGYRERILLNSYYNPNKERLHLYLNPYESLKDLRSRRGK
jgi:hypothetical protein